jgi:hypothetical protein
MSPPGGEDASSQSAHSLRSSRISQSWPGFLFWCHQRGNGRNWTGWYVRLTSNDCLDWLNVSLIGGVEIPTPIDLVELTSSDKETIMIDPEIVAFTADIPCISDVLKVIGHSGYSACLTCDVSGAYLRDCNSGISMKLKLSQCNANIRTLRN